MLIQAGSLHPTIKLLDASSLAQLSFLLSSNFTAYLPVLYLIVTWFSPPNSGPNLLHILVLNSNCLPLIILNQMAKQNVSTNVLNSTCRTSVCTNKTIGSIGLDEWNFNITTSFMIPLVLLLSLLAMVFILFFYFPNFTPGDLVMLSHCNIKTTQPSNKFNYCKLGPFKIISTIGSNAYHLQHPAALLQLHPVFNINLLEPYVQSDLPDHLQSTTAIPDMILEGENTLNMKQILDICKTGHCLDYLLDYVNKLISDCSWVPLSDIPSSYDELLECFHHCHPSLLKPSSHALKSKSHTTTPISHDPPCKCPLSSYSSGSRLFYVSSAIVYHNLI